MVAGDFNAPAGLGRDGITRLDTAVDPVADMAPFDSTTRTQALDDRPAPLDEFFDRQTGAGDRVINQAVSPDALSHAWAGRDDDEIGLLKATGFRIQVIEARRDANHR